MRESGCLGAILIPEYLDFHSRILIWNIFLFWNIPIKRTLQGEDLHKTIFVAKIHRNPSNIHKIMTMWVYCAQAECLYYFADLGKSAVHLRV